MTAPSPETAAPIARRPRTRLPILLLGAVVMLPVLVAAVRVATLGWTPTGDLGQAALRFVNFLDHPPLVGAAGRITDAAGTQGNHPGPAMFWAVWPFHAVLGDSGAAFGVATTLVNLVWLALGARLVRRRTGPGPALLVPAAILLILLGQWGLDVLTQLWNPWAAMAPFLVLLLACWSLLEGDRCLWLVALAASYVVQCHVGYVVPVAVIGGGTVLVALVRAVRARARWWPQLIPAAAVTALIWAPPVIEELRGRPGNLSVLWWYFTNSTDTPVGFGRALRITAGLFDPVGQWVVTGPRPGGSVVLGALLFGLWAAGAVTGWRTGSARRWLDLVLALAVLAAVLAVSRVFGELFLYLFRWITTITAVMVGSVVWAALETAGTRRARRANTAAASPRPIWIAGVGVVAVLAVGMSVRVARSTVPYPFGWRTEAVIAPAVVSRLTPGTRYLLTWDDPITLGGLGFGLLVRTGWAGLDVAVPPSFAAGVEAERTMNPAEAEARVVLVTGPRVAAWRAAYPDAVIAEADVRSPAARAEAEERATRAAATLGISRKELARRPWFGMALDTSLPSSARDDIGELINLGSPVLVLLLPAGAPDPAPDAAP